MNSQDTRHGIMITLGGTLIGALLYIFALSLDNHFVIITNYIIAMILYTCSFLAAFQQYKKNVFSSHDIYSYIDYDSFGYKYIFFCFNILIKFT